MFAGADVKLMETKLNPQIMEATGLMDKARAWLGSDTQSRPALTQKLIGDMDVRLVMHAHGFAKKVKTRKQYHSLEAIAQDLANEVRDAGGNASNSPWEPPAAESAPAASAQVDKQNTITQLVSDGSLDIGQFKKDFGMELGTFVARRAVTKKRNVSVIVKIEGQTITLASPRARTITVTAGELVAL